MKLTDLMEAGKEKPFKYGLVCVSDDGHADFDNFEETKVFLDHFAFEEYIADLFEMYASDSGSDVGDLIDSDDDATPEAKAAAAKLAKRKEKGAKVNKRTIFYMSQREDWDTFIENVWIVDKF